MVIAITPTRDNSRVIAITPTEVNAPAFG